MIQLDNLTKSFDGKTVIAGLSLILEEGLVYGVMGASGIGKTTLLHLLSGLQEPDAGTVSGMESKTKSFLFQENRLLPWQNVYDNIRYVTGNRERIQNALLATGLWEDRFKFPGELSGGMARRAAIARAAAFGGDIFFIDEPLYGLDVKTGRDILSLIKKTVQGKTAFIVTHSPDEAFYLADRILFLKNAPVSCAEIKEISNFASPQAIKDYLL